MVNKKLAGLTLFLLAASTITTEAGGLLTNTNQSVSFLRNPARDAAIGIDGVYSNPAGVVFMGDGLHLAFNWQAAFQTRTIHSTDPVFALGEQNNGATTKRFRGKATAPVLPSIQGALNKGRWSFQLNIALSGGGGKCTFDDGLGSFESAVGQIATLLQPLGVTGYDMNSFMEGKQYYFGATLGAAYKVNEHLSVYAGVRALYGIATYKAKISDIQVRTQNGLVPFGTFLDNTATSLNASLAQVDAGLAHLQPIINQYGDNTPAQYREQYNTLLNTRNTITQTQASLNSLEVYRAGVNLQSDQHGLGFAPIIGVDYRTGNFNFAAKYEFRTKMAMKNSSTVNEVMAIEAVNQYLDGTKIREDSPALLALGAQWEPTSGVRVNAGYHHFYDRQSKKYGDKQKLLDGGTDEYLAGAEWDITKKLTASGGIQITRYGLTDEYMSDMSFVTNSWTFGLGARYQLSEKLAINAAYFQTNYDKYHTQPSESGAQNTFTRTNKVLGVGVEYTF